MRIQNKELHLLMIKKENRGGYRKGSGAKPKYNEKTETVSFRCPVSKVAQMKKIILSEIVKFLTQ